MKSILLVFVLTLITYSNEISNIRTLYLLAYTSESLCNEFGEELEDTEFRDSILVQGYQGCFYCIKCKFINNPIDKIRYFNKGKNLIESAIMQDPKSVELKFLRYSIQKNLPRFLLYNNSIEKDLNFVNQNIKNINDKEVQVYIRNSLKSISK